MTTLIDLSSYVNSNSKFGNKKLKVNKLTDSAEFNFGNTLDGQVKLTKSGNKVIINVYKTTAVTYTYRKVHIEWGHKGKSGYPRWVTTYYYDKNGNEINYTTSHKHYSKPGKDSTTYYVYKNGKKYKTSTLSSIFTKYVSSEGSVSKTKLGTYTLLGIYNAGNGISVTANGDDILQMIWEIKSGTHNHTFTGSELNEYAVSTKANEVFRMGSGKDKIYFEGSASYGNDTVYLSKNSSLDLCTEVGKATWVERQKNTNNVVVYIGDGLNQIGKVSKIYF